MTVNTTIAVNGQAVIYPTNSVSTDNSATPVLIPINVWTAMVVELRVISVLLNENIGSKLNLNQLRIDELSNIVPPGAL